MTNSRNLTGLLVFVYFVIARSWLSYSTGSVVGVDAWDYMSWIRSSTNSQELLHAPLHVPGFYAILSVIAVYTGIDPIYLYTFVMPPLFGLLLYSTSTSIMNEWGLLVSSLFGFYVLRTSMVIPEVLGIVFIPTIIYGLVRDIQGRERSNLVFLLVTCNLVIWIHHLSGGIVLFIILFYTVLHPDIELGILLFIVFCSALISWIIASGFPLQLIFEVIDQFGILPILACFILVIVLSRRGIIYQLTHFASGHMRKLSLLIIAYAAAIAFYQGLNWVNILYWSPALILLPLSFSRNQRHESFVFWIMGLLFLTLFCSMLPLILPLVARLLVFNIQAMIAVSGFTIAMVIEQLQHRSSRTYVVILFSCLLLTSFHTYPLSDAWFDTEFRYFDEEIEAGLVINKFYSGVIDTDNRMGVMLRGVVLLESTYGELDTSWLAQILKGSNVSLTDDSLFIINDVIRTVGFMLGKFIHGKGGTGELISVDFEEHVEFLLSKLIPKIGQIGSNSLWLS